jgi:type I restriction enzyme S subunit
MSYREEQLGDYIDVLSGFAFKTKDFSEKGVPIIKIKNIKPPEVTLEDLTYVSNEVAKKQNRFYLSYDDVLIAMTGSHINQWSSVVGRVAKVKYHSKTLLNQRVGKIVVNDNTIADKDYIYYYLSQDLVKIELAAKAGGAANQANISPSDIKNLRFPCPEITIQKKIGQILRVYDDLIENNQKQIKLLEEAAQRLYKEWFVDFRFPGYEDVEIIDGLPEGWKYRFVGDFGEVITGKTPSTTKSEYYDGNIPFVTIPDMHGKVFPLTTEKSLTTTGANTQKNKFLPAGAVMVSCIGTVGLVNIAVEPCQTNQQINSVILSSDIDLYYFYESVLRIRDLLDGVGSNGATMTNVNKTKFSNIKVVYPTDNLIEKYNQFCKPLFEKILCLSKAIIMTEQARDRLLPKLINREIEV